MAGRVVRAPRGTEISCRSWQQEAALRMLMNNLDPEVAERPQDLVVYGGIGRAARKGKFYDALGAAHEALRDHDALLLDAENASGVFKAQPYASRALPAY